MGSTSKSETGELLTEAHADAAPALPDAPLAMPVQSLDRPALLALLRVLLGASGRAVRH